MAESDGDELFESRSNSFLDWLDRNNTTTSSKIQLIDLRHRFAGRGVVAKDDIDEDEELFVVPRPTILTVENSRLPPHIREQVDDPWLSLMLAMTLEYQAGQESRWKPYFDVLPTTFDTLMYWTTDELKNLQGSAVVSKIGKQTANDTFTNRLVPLVRSNEALFNTAGISDEDLLSLFHRMGSTIMAYAFDLESSTPQEQREEDGWEEDSDAGETLAKGMVPLADMLNADADRNNAKLFYEEDKVVMKAIKSIRKGEELFNDYGPLPRADLLRRYGYLSDNYAAYDVVDVSLDSIRDATTGQMRLSEDEAQGRIEYLEEQGVIEDGYDISRTSGEDGPFPEELIMLLNGVVLEPADFDKLRMKDKLPKGDPSRDAQLLLNEILVRRLSEYPILINKPDASDVENNLVANSSMQRRSRMATQVLAGEKQVLNEAISHLEAIAGQLPSTKRTADQHSHNDSHKLKRQKTG